MRFNMTDAVAKRVWALVAQITRADHSLPDRFVLSLRMCFKSHRREVPKRAAMRSKPNYRQERAQKSRVRETRKEEKLQRRDEAAARRKSLREDKSGVEVAGSKPVVDKTAEPPRE